MNRQHGTAPETREDSGPQAHGETRMRAVVQHCYGPPAVLDVAEMPRPRPQRGEVLVSVLAASIHPGDVFVAGAQPAVVRLAFGLRRPRNPVPASDFAGVVAEVGEGVDDLRPGDRVLGWSTRGALAEFVRVRADRLVPTPDDVSDERAATLATSAMTALQALRDVAKVQTGQRVLVIGASGGVGTFAVQIAKELGAHVTGVCSARNLELVRTLGADRVIDYTASDVTESDESYDVILDNVESQPLGRVRRVLSETGTLIPNSGRGGPLLGPIPRVLRAYLLSAVLKHRIAPFTSIGTRRDLAALARMVADGRITPVIDRSFPLAAAREAMEYVASGRGRGKVVVTI